MITWVECFGAFAIVWGFLVALLLCDWLVSIYYRFKA